MPKLVRTDLSKKYEEDDEPAAHPYCYTNLVHLDKILEYNWKELISVLPKNVSADRKKLSKNLNRLNRIRNYVMHPVKGIYPTEDAAVLAAREEPEPRAEGRPVVGVVLVLPDLAELADDADVPPYVIF